MRTATVNFLWSAGNENLIAGMDSFFSEWRRTPYRSGQSVPGIDGGVDCVNFITRFYGRMCNVEVESLSLPLDSALHDEASLTACAASLLAKFKFERIFPLDTGQIPVSPGDLAVCAFPGKGPGHCMIVGTAPSVMWHCDGSCVARTGYDLIESGMYQFSRVYTCKENFKWH